MKRFSPPEIKRGGRRDERKEEKQKVQNFVGKFNIGEGRGTIWHRG